MRLAYRSAVAVGVLLSIGCEPPRTELVAPASLGARSLEHDYLIPASNGLGVAHQGITVGDGPNGQQVLYVNFDGQAVTRTTNNGDPANDDARVNKSWVPNVGGSTVTVPAFDTNKYSGSYTAQQAKDYIITHVTDWYATYNVYVTATRPSSGRYTMVIVGGLTANFVTGSGDAVGVAPLDCGNDNQNTVGFVFSDSLAPASTSFMDRQLSLQLISHAVTHEAGHSFGLEHVVQGSPIDIMVPAVDPAVQGFLGGAHNLSDGASQCVASTTTEDTNARLLGNLGAAPTGPSLPKPNVTWLAPKPGVAVPRNFTAAVSASQPSGAGGTITKVEITQNGLTAATLTAPPYRTGFSAPNTIPDGSSLSFTAIAYNSLGGKASVQTTFTVQSGATEPPLPCLVAVDCQSDETCSGGHCVAGTASSDGAATAQDMAPASMTVNVGMECTDSSECGGDGVCAAAGGKHYCTQKCSSNDGCPSDYTCAPVGADHYCAPKSKGCDFGGSFRDDASPSALAWLGLAAAVWLTRRRARRSAT